MYLPKTTVTQHAKRDAIKLVSACQPHLLADIARLADVIKIDSHPEPVTSILSILSGVARCRSSFSAKLI
jgi:hypothetical protein